MKFLFIVQGEGRGHLTQALALEEILRKGGHEVVETLVGKSNSRQLPGFFNRNMKAPIRRFDSPNFQPSAAPCGARLDHAGFDMLAWDFNSRAPCGARHDSTRAAINKILFQLTRPMRGATFSFIFRPSGSRSMQRSFCSASHFRYKNALRSASLPYGSDRMCSRGILASPCPTP